MIYKIKIKNSPELVLVSADVYQHLVDDAYLSSVGFLQNLRLHSSGYAFFQKNYPQKNGKYKNETIYLHRYIAERFLPKPPEGAKYASIVNGNKLDCRTENIEWTTRSKAVRNTRKTINQTGFRGVCKEGNRYRAVIYNGSQKIDLGFFDTPETAALAYNKKSEELFGRTRSLNNIKPSRINRMSDTTE